MDVKDAEHKEIQVKDQEPLVGPALVKKSSRKRSITIFAVVSTINIALLALLWTQLLTPAKNAPSNINSNSEVTGDISSPLIGKPAPDFSLAKLGEKGSLRLSDFKGKAVILNFWASWCEPCKEEAPLLQKEWATRLQARNVVLLGVDGPERTENALKFLQKYAITYPNVQDTLDGSTAINYGVTRFPETIFINRDGIVVAKYIAPLTKQGLEFELKKLNL
jgi:cytochrome c biogenesis protein CcmG/thiol:disulfide interchange protein DsbE